MDNWQTTATRLCMIVLIPLLGLVLSACGPAPLTRTGFLSDYSRLQKSDTHRMRFISPQLSHYTAYMIDPVEMRIDRTVLKPNHRAEVARYMRDAISQVLTARGYRLANTAGTDTARLRIAITDVQKSTWWMNVHPGTKLTGAGTGGASMEGEVIDSVTGAQVAAVIQSGKGNQFELDTFSEIDDVEDVIDKWAENAGKQLDDLRNR